jgi:hypothetical protein
MTQDFLIYVFFKACDNLSVAIIHSVGLSFVIHTPRQNYSSICMLSFQLARVSIKFVYLG